MGTTVGDLLSLQNGSFGTVKYTIERKYFQDLLKKP